jgi:hypothetical protein
MAEVMRGVHVVPPIAGISIVHEADEGIEFLGSPTFGANPVDVPDGSIWLRHRVGASDFEQLRPVVRVNERVTYYDGGSAGPVVRMEGLDPAAPLVVLRTEHPGYEYAVEYARMPLGPVLHRGAEMSAYALALAARERGLLAHGCGFVLPSGSAALCLGVSGAGKSTLARMMTSAAGCCVLNDDRLVLTRESTGLQMWSTPWPGNAGIAREGDAPLGVIALIGRGSLFSVRSLMRRDALQRLLKTLLVPLWDMAHAGAGLDLVDDLIASVPIVELAYPLAHESPELIVNALTEIAR